ncbi:MAG: hypothetical protein AAFZ87_08660 [Planctomycetota bacterium]
MNNAKTSHRARSRSRLLPLAGVAGALFFSCMAAPPSTVLAFEGGRVLAATSVEAESVEALLKRLRPELLAMLPDADFEDLEVWIQERPSLYRYATDATADAEGLWSPSHRRIMLSRHADHLERTLAHELTHAVLGESWAMLPGSLEEGLADHVSASLCEDGAARLSAGRLSSACLATGGLEIDLDVFRRAPDGSPEPEERGWSARVKLRGDTDNTDPLDVFRLAAGLSSTRIDSGSKRGFYGLAYLVVTRIVERGGYGALHTLCVDAEAEGLERVPVTRVLEAAGLSADPADWRAAAARAMTRDDVVELLRMYPDFLVDGLVDYVEELGTDQLADAIDLVDVRVGVRGGVVRVGLDDLPFVRTAVVDALTQR